MLGPVAAWSERGRTDFGHSANANCEFGSGGRPVRALARLNDGPGDAQRRVMLMIILLVFVVLAIAGGGWGHSRYGYAGWSPLGIILAVVVVLWFTGRLHS
jgi:hypothetical protein